MKSKLLLSITLFFFTLSASAQIQKEALVNQWSNIPNGVYKIVVIGQVRVTILKDKTNHYDFGTDLKNYISSGQEKEGSSFVSNGTLTINSEATEVSGQIRIFLKDPLMDIDLSEGALLIYETKISQPSMTVKLNNSKLYSEKRFSVDNFVLENHKGIIELKKANIDSAIFNLTQGTKNNISGSVDNQQIYVIVE